MMDVLKLIKTRQAIKSYKNMTIPKHIVEKIIEAGLWGPSIFGMQPWELIVIENKIKIKEIHDFLKKKFIRQEDIWLRYIFEISIKTISTTSILIAIYNSNEFIEFIKRLNKKYLRVAEIAEIGAISAAIQNMILTAESLGIGTSWLDSPLICEKQINKLLNNNKPLVALLGLGYFEQKKIRSKRKEISKAVRYL